MCCLLVSPYFNLTYLGHLYHRWKPFDPARNFPDLGPRFKDGEEQAKAALRRAVLAEKAAAAASLRGKTAIDDADSLLQDLPVSVGDKRDLDWSTVLKRTFEAYIRGERPNMYGEWLAW